MAMFMSCFYCKKMGCFRDVLIFMNVVLKVWNAILCQLDINYPHTIISMKLLKLTELYTATMKGSKQLLRKT